jgi:uncharacterized protein (UPF0276 family)
MVTGRGQHARAKVGYKRHDFTSIIGQNETVYTARTIIRNDLERRDESRSILTTIDLRFPTGLDRDWGFAHARRIIQWTACSRKESPGMQFALNYSPQAAGLLFDGRIQPDRFKCPNWPDLIAEASRLLPVYVHFDLIAGNGGLEAIDWDGVEKVLKTTETPYVNLHLAPMMNASADGVSDLTEDRPRVIEQMRADMSRVAQRFGAERVIVENVPYRSVNDPHLRRRFYRACVEPDVISALLEETKCGFLLDISHARIAAETLGLDAKTYIEALPLRRLRELHVTGIERGDGGAEDHMPMTENDWTMFEWVMGKIASGEAAEPWMVAFEYGGIGKIFEWRSDSFVIATQVPRLYDSVHGVKVGNSRR